MSTNVMNDKRLSKLQKHIIDKLGDVIVNSFGDEPECSTDIRYKVLFDLCSDYWFQGVPAIAGESRRNVAKSAFSRAVWSLIERGILTGVALAWCDITTTDHIRWHGGGPDRRVNGYAEPPRPQTKMLSLSDDGMRLYRSQQQQQRTQRTIEHQHDE